MSKEPWELDNELEELEKDMVSKFEGLESAPLRAGFQEELRGILRDELEDKQTTSILMEGSKEKGKSLLSLLKSSFGGKGSGGFRNWKAVTSVGLVIVLLTAVFWGAGLTMQPGKVQASGISITALTGDGLGIDPETAFLLKSEVPLAEKSVEQALKIDPAFEFTLDKQAGGKEYKIIPQEKLNPNTIYTLSFDPDGRGKENLSWAFQTKSKFRVIRSLPYNQSTHVPVDTGIELLFSHEKFDFAKIKEYFSISPQVEGRFEQHKKTLVFLPKDLQPSTIYTVTLKKGFPMAGGAETLEEDYVFSFETRPQDENQTGFNFDLNNSLAEFATTDIPAFPVYFYREYGQGNGTGVPPLTINLYRYPDVRSFQASLAKRDEIPRWSYFNWNRYQEDLNPQYKIAEIKTEFLKVNNYTYYVVFPQELEAGYYAAEFQAEDSVRQVWFQVSDLAVYLAQGKEKSLFWVNDLNTKAPAKDVKVTIDSKNLAVQGDDSGAVLVKENLLGKARDYALVQSGSKETLVPLEAWTPWYAQGTADPANSADPAGYWKYLYLDRELYQPEDTVNFWGVLQPRGEALSSGQGKAAVKEVTIELMGSDGPYYEGAETSPILTQKAAVQDKTFSGQLKLPVLKPGYYYLQLKVGETALLSRGFEVETYQKPSYKLTVTQDKKAIFAGETVNFLAKTSFFEGTPVPGLSLNYYVDGQQGKVITNSQGEVSIPYNGTSYEDIYSSYRYVSLGVNGALPETGEIFSSGELYVFKSKVYLTAQAERKDDGYSLNAKLSAVDLTEINNGQYLAEEHFLEGPVAGSPIKAALYQEIWTPVESGEQYDFINKKVVKTYYYEYSTKHLSDLELLTDNQGIATTSGKLDPSNSYYFDLTAVDSEGRSFTKRIHLGGYTSYNPDYQYYFLQGKQGVIGYQPGEEAKVTLMVNDKELRPASKSVLFYQGQTNLENYLVSDSPKYSFTFEEKYIPNVSVGAVYFDGYGYHEAYAISIPYDTDSKALNVQITTDQAEYRPGGKVKLAVQVTDAAGKPVDNAQVNLNLVDEALFSLREQNVNFLNSLYGDQFYLFLLTWKSHDHPSPGGGAESGGEGGSERRDFQDTVLFTTLQTNDQGKADVEFDLPDNLTSWRVTYHAFTQDLQAGSGASQIPVRLPFFAEMIVNPTYLAGDAPVALLRSYGEKLRKDQEVSYNLTLRDSQGQEKNWTVKGKAFTSVDFKLPTLQAGTYSLTVKAVSGELTDTLTREFTAAKSFQERTLTSHEILTEGLKVKGSATEPTTVVFSDYEKSRYLRGLYQLAWSYGSRLEQKLAGLEARRLLKEYFPDEKFFGNGEDQESLLVYQQADGGISILPYGGSELPLSAMVASSTSGIFDEGALAHYFYRLLEAYDQGEDRSLALLGLASLKEPVLLEINAFIHEEKLEPEVKINLALALLEIGDGAYAQEVFRELITLYGEDLGSVMRINVGRDQDEMIQATTQMALLASRLDQPEKHKLYQYLLENRGKEILNLVEQIQILKYNLKYMESEPVSFTYELNGEKVSKSLKGRETFRLTLLPADLEKIQFSGIKGQVGVVSKYGVPIQADETGNGEDLKISRSYQAYKKSSASLSRTDLVQVTINYTIGDKAPAGLYEIVDVLPAGLAHISRPYSYDKESYKQKTLWSYPDEVNGQRLVFQVGKGQNKITYLARVVSPGEFNCEAPVLSNIQNNSIYTSGSQDKLVIK